MKVKFTITGEFEVDKEWFENGTKEAEIKEIIETDLKESLGYSAYDIENNKSTITLTISQ